ncbi:hypothetical protein D3C73_933810 [compost metagenome]
MVLEETDEELQWKTEHVCHRHRPDGGAHRHDVMQGEALAVAVRRQVIPELGMGGDAAFGEVAWCLFVEAQNVSQHSPEPGRQQIAALGEQAVEVVAVIFQATVGVCDRETHLRRLEAHANLPQQANEIRIGPVVKHNEAGVHDIAATIDAHVHAVGVAADAVIGLKQSDLVVATQQVGAGQPRDAAANDCDVHVASLIGGLLRTMRLPMANFTPLGIFDRGHSAAMNSAGNAISRGRSLSLAKM